MLISVTARPISKKSILSSVRVTTTPELETFGCPGLESVKRLTSVTSASGHIEPSKPTRVSSGGLNSCPYSTDGLLG